MFRLVQTVLLIVLATMSPLANAYVGPGLGTGALGVILGILASVLIALFAVFWYPAKKLYKRLRKNPDEEQEEPAT